MNVVVFLLFTLIYRTVCVEQCYNKPCACCRTPNCSPVNNTCENGCVDGYTGDNCYNSCPVNCVNCWQNNREICDTCRDGYHNGYWHDDQTSGPWSENCSHKCRPPCKSCYRYRICTECADGFFKNQTFEDCRLQCPQRCKSCISESDCTECKPGFFGQNCSEYCGKGCNTPTCDRRTGWCNCTENYTGIRCKRCMLGKYGIDCDLDCPENCILCNQSGMCLLCKKGFSGLYCTENAVTDAPATKRAVHTTQTVSASYTEVHSGNTDDSHVVNAILGSVFGSLSIGLFLLTVFLCWRNYTRTYVKIDVVSSEKNQDTEQNLKGDPCKDDAEIEIYDEIPCYWSKPKEKASYLNPNMEMFDEIEDIDDDSNASFEDCKKMPKIDSLASIYKDPSNDESGSCTDVSGENNKLDEKENFADDNQSNYSFTTELMTDKEKIRIEEEDLDSHDYEQVAKRKESMWSGERDTGESDPGGLEGESEVGVEHDDTCAQCDQDKTSSKSEGKLQNTGDYEGLRSQSRSIKSELESEEKLQKVSDYEGVKKTTKSVKSEGKTQNTGDYEGLKSKNKSMKSVGTVICADQLRIEGDFKKPEKPVESNVSTMAQKKKGDKSKLKLKYLTSRDHDDDAHTKGVDKKAGKYDHLKKEGDAKKISNDYVDVTRMKGSSKRGLIPGHGSLTRKDIDGEDYENLKTETEGKDLIEEKGLTKYYDSSRVQGGISKCAESDMAAASEHDYESLQEKRDISHARTSSKPGKDLKATHHGSFTRARKSKKDLKSDGDYEKLRPKTLKDSASDETEDANYINVSYV